MSLSLELGTKPNGLSVKSNSASQTIWVGDYEISMRDFLYAAEYVLTNTDLVSADDPRLRFLRCVRSMCEVEGYNPGQKRLLPLEFPPF